MQSPVTIDSISQGLSGIVGAEHCNVGHSCFTVSPADTGQVAAILRLATDAGLIVEICGAGTKRHWGADVRASLHLHTGRLNTVCEHTWQDLTCTVQAGCTWQTMQAALAQHGQFVALDPLDPSVATLGGIIATNDSGSLRLKFGSLRDLVIGMTIVLADGTVAKSGGKVVKNVAGYDLHKLMIGAHGTLGVITEITFRLHAIPRHTGSFSFASPAPEPLGDLLLGLLNSQLNLQAIQLRTAVDGFHLDVELAALPAVILQQADSLSAMAKSFNLAISAAAPDIWQTRHAIAMQTETCIAKATVLPTQIASIAAAVQALGGSAVTQASGVMFASLPLTATDGILSLRQQLEQAGGSLTILRGSSDTHDRWGKLPDSIDLMHRIKQQFDPNHILNPGRLIGGI